MPGVITIAQVAKVWVQVGGLLDEALWELQVRSEIERMVTAELF
jgi:hypothetical protein